MQKRIILLLMIVLFNFVQNVVAVSCENESKISPKDCYCCQNSSTTVDIADTLIEKDGSLLVNKKHSDSIIQNEQTSLLENFSFKLKVISSNSKAILYFIEYQSVNKINETSFFLSSVRASNSVSFLTCCNFRI